MTLLASGKYTKSTKSSKCNCLQRITLTFSIFILHTSSWAIATFKSMSQNNTIAIKMHYSSVHAELSASQSININWIEIDVKLREPWDQNAMSCLSISTAQEPANTQFNVRSVQTAKSNWFISLQKNKNYCYPDCVAKLNLLEGPNCICSAKRKRTYPLFMEGKSNVKLRSTVPFSRTKCIVIWNRTK